MTYFNNKSFRSVVAFPYLSVEKKGGYWNVTLPIARELYFYQYPFQFPNFFQTYSNKYDFALTCIRIPAPKIGNRLVDLEIVLIPLDS